MGLGALGVALLGTARRNRQHTKARRRTLTMLLCCFAIAGCGGGTKFTTMNITESNPTPAQTSTVTIAATASGNINHSIPLVVVVQ